MSSTQLIPLIIISGEAGATTKTFCKELGATAYFEKPVDFDALQTGLAKILHAVQPERRSEARVHLRVKLKLQGADISEKPFEEVCATENVSRNGFLCGCTALLKIGSIIEVQLVSGGANFVGKASVIRSEGYTTCYPRYGFRFVEEYGDWILQ